MSQAWSNVKQADLNRMEIIQHAFRDWEPSARVPVIVAATACAECTGQWLGKGRWETEEDAYHLGLAETI